MEGIRSVVFNSPSGLLDQFKEEHTNDPTMISALEKLPENPFGGLMRAVIVLEEFSNDGVIIAKIKDAGKGFGIINPFASSRQLRDFRIKIFSRISFFTFLTHSRISKALFSTCVTDPESDKGLLELYPRGFNL
ncbi:MAG: hypothetical protein AAB967_00065 [Patescibacteria group bacterium]